MASEDNNNNNNNGGNNPNYNYNNRGGESGKPNGLRPATSSRSSGSAGSLLDENSLFAQAMQARSHAHAQAQGGGTTPRTSTRELLQMMQQHGYYGQQQQQRRQSMSGEGRGGGEEGSTMLQILDDAIELMERSSTSSLHQVTAARAASVTSFSTSGISPPRITAGSTAPLQDRQRRRRHHHNHRHDNTMMDNYNEQ